MKDIVEIQIPNEPGSDPVKKIFDSQTTASFQKSLALQRLKICLNHILNSVHNVVIPAEGMPDDVLQVETLLECLGDLIDQTPAHPGPRRFGNLARRDWNLKMEAALDPLLQVYPENIRVELRYYIGNAFGSSERLDYGTGHELSFLAFLCALWMNDNLSDMNGGKWLYLFASYYKVVQKLILTYTLEPAGSHGVWGLDDHFHLCYILGAAQLLDSQTLEPRDTIDQQTAAKYKDKNLYFLAISFIYTVKSGNFFEHSPILFDISKIQRWEKVIGGLVKMYYAEVLGKFPVVQHFWFGTLFYPWTNEHGEPLPDYEPPVEEHSLNHPTVNTAAPWLAHRGGQVQMPVRNSLHMHRDTSSRLQTKGYASRQDPLCMQSAPVRTTTTSTMPPPSTKFPHKR